MRCATHFESTVAQRTLPSEAKVHKMSNILDVAGPDRRRRAWSIVAMMIGAIAISRAMPDGEEADQALDSALQTATALVARK
jgi:TetR/AcrR family transcriptional repressor of nem operon